MAFQIGPEMPHQRRAKKSAQVGRIEVVTKARERRFGCAHGSAWLGLGLQDQHLAPGAGENDARRKAIETRSDDDDVVAQGSIRFG